MPEPEPQTTVFYDRCRRLVDFSLSALHDFEVHGLRHIPPTGPLILAANHVSFYDPPAVGAKVRRQLHYFARDTLYRGAFGKVLRKLETIPVARDRADVASLKGILRALKNGGAVVIYPEGTRSPDGNLLPPKPGAGMIACKSGATVVPTRLFGTYEAFGRQHRLPRFGGPIQVVYGPPLQPSDYDPGTGHDERYLEASRRIMERIAALTPPQREIV